jgi:hypothetical protein
MPVAISLIINDRKELEKRCVVLCFSPDKVLYSRNDAAQLTGGMLNK